MIPIFLTARAKKETRNRYFLAESLHYALPAVDVILFRKSKLAVREISLSGFCGSGLHYQDAYSSWLITKAKNIFVKGAGTGPGHAVARSNGVAWRRVSINYSHNDNRRSLSTVFAFNETNSKNTYVLEFC